jgi:hypothetical protein
MVRNPAKWPDGPAYMYKWCFVSINPVRSPSLLFAATKETSVKWVEWVCPTSVRSLIQLKFDWQKVGKHGIWVRICTIIWRQKCRRHKNKCPNIPGHTDTISCIWTLSIILIFLKTQCFGTQLCSSPGKLARNLLNPLNHATLSLAITETLNLLRYAPQNRSSPRVVKTAI